jgi:hypothetical protein
MAAAAKPRIPGVTLTTEGHWRCNNCARATVKTPVCAGAHDDGGPSCGKAVCAHCADRCIRCRAYLCPDCFQRSTTGSLCVACPPPADGREAHLSRQRARAGAGAAGEPDWRADSDRAYHAAAEAQRSVDEAMRRADDIERQLKEMKARARKAQDAAKPGQPPPA